MTTTARPAAPPAPAGTDNLRRTAFVVGALFLVTYVTSIAAKFGVPLYETPVGFKYIGEKLIAGEIIFGAEESAGLTVEGHVPEKDGILADLLAAEMVGATGKSIAALTADLEREIGAFHTSRLDLPLSPGDQKALKARRAARCGCCSSRPRSRRPVARSM